MKRLLLVGPSGDLTFVAQDLRILRQEYDVDTVWRSDFRSERATVRSAFNKLLTNDYSILFVWFAEPYDAPWLMALAKLFGIPSVLVVGGYETIYIPEVGYGSMRHRRNRLKLKAALRWATIVLPTSNLLSTEVRELEPLARREVIPPGIDCGVFRLGDKERDALVVTVGTVSGRTIRLKGLDVFAKVSREFPEVTFAILGPSESTDSLREVRELGGRNLLVEGKQMTSNELVIWFQRAKVYAQFSVRESFGVALAEAMACGCSPLVADSGALPDVVGETGATVPYGDVEATIEAMRELLAIGGCRTARQRVLENFDLEARTRRLMDVLRRVSL